MVGWGQRWLPAPQPAPCVHGSSGKLSRDSVRTVWHGTLPRDLPEVSEEEQTAPKVEPLLRMALSNPCHSHDAF